MYDPVSGNKKASTSIVLCVLWEDAIKTTWAEAEDERKRKAKKNSNVSNKINKFL